MDLNQKKDNMKKFDYVTYAFYNNKGERMSIFYKDGQIIAIPCSKKDQFCKKMAILMYETGIYNRYTEASVEKGITQRQFIAWCDANFKRLKTASIPYSGNIVDISIVGLTKLLLKHKILKIKYV